jgi:hypothetical protein
MIYNDIMNTEIGGDIISRSFTSLPFPPLVILLVIYILYIYHIIHTYIYTQHNEAA